MGTDSSPPIRFGLIALAIKFGPKLLSLLVKSKAFWAAASFAAYSSIFSWKFALILLGSVFFHELGHVRAMRAFGVPVKGIYLLPFMGGVAVATGQAPNRKADAYIALWGPLWGFALALATLDVYALTGSEYAAAIAAWMAAVNLFNLLPVWPLDGGRLIASVARSAGTTAGFMAMAVGCGVLLVGALILKLPLFAFLLVAGGFELRDELGRARFERERKNLRNQLATAFKVNDEDLIAEIERRFSLAERSDISALPYAHMLGTERGDRFRQQIDGEHAGYAKAVSFTCMLQLYLTLTVSNTITEDNTAMVLRHALTEDRAGFYAVLADPKQPDPMSARQAAAAMAGYALLVAALAGVLYATQINPVAAAALDIFSR